jgi:hypothetical protein
MPQADLSLDQVGKALKTCGHYRVVRAQEIANEGNPDRISGATLLALGLRETKLANINGGAVKAPDGSWVAAQPIHQDGGFLQISRDHHPVELSLMPGVASGTWGPVVAGKSAFTPGYCPRFTDAIRFTIDSMHEAMAFAEDSHVPEDELLRFAVAAHNGGMGGAIRGFREGDVDRYTALGDYSAWVIRHRKLIQQWLGQHDNWRYKA